MRIFALETDREKLRRRFLSEGEREIRTISFHGFRFFLRMLWDIFWAIIVILFVLGVSSVGLPLSWVAIAAGIPWFLFMFASLLKAYIDWRYDFILITTDKVIVVDQSSLFHQKVTPMNLENFASVSAETQFWNLFPFGILHFNLKEGAGNGVKLRYIPHVHDAASVISDAITTFQRRKDLRRYGGGPEEAHASG